MRFHCTAFISTICLASLLSAAQQTKLRCDVVDADSGQPLACRVYLRSEDGNWFFVRSADSAGSAIEYRKQRGANSVEMHTTVSAGGFVAELPTGGFELTVERGKEYLPHRQTIRIGQQAQRLTVRLQRWIDMAADNWYSGETHVHRTLEELPNLMLAEDLNVALPLTYWVTVSDTPPGQSGRHQPPPSSSLLAVDETHVMWPLNTEYEIFRVGAQRHTLGAIFALNHKTVLQRGVPPVRPIAERVHQEGGLLELDKHNWPWSMMLVPVTRMDLYELTNNHIWRTEFAFRNWAEQPPAYMNAERDEDGLTERGWIDFTFQNYYALLNCGFRLRPTAGTASGVHPVPLGFGRVYVHLPRGFSYQAWMQGLDAGRTFVTTGPMLVVRLNDQPLGTTFELKKAGETFRLQGSVRSAHPLKQLEIVAAGEVLRSISPSNDRAQGGGYRNAVQETVTVEGSTWLAVRCFSETPEGRPRFAHTAPFHLDLASGPLRPRREEVDYLIQRIEDEIARNDGVVSEAAMQEYRDALAAYQDVRRRAR